MRHGISTQPFSNQRSQKLPVVDGQITATLNPRPSTKIHAATDILISRARFSMRQALDHTIYQLMVWNGLLYDETTLDGEIGDPVH